MRPDSSSGGRGGEERGEFWGSAFSLLLQSSSRGNGTVGDTAVTLDVHVQTEFAKTVNVPLDPGRLDLLGEFRKTPVLMGALVEPSYESETGAGDVKGAILLSSSDTSKLIELNQENSGASLFQPLARSRAFPVVLGTCAPASIYTDTSEVYSKPLVGEDVSKLVFLPEDLFSLKVRLLQVIILLFDGRVATLDRREWHYLVKVLISLSPSLAGKFYRYIKEGIVFLSEAQRLQTRSSRTMQLLSKAAELSTEPLRFDEQDVRGELEVYRQMLVYTKRFFGSTHAEKERDAAEGADLIVEEGALPSVPLEMLSSQAWVTGRPGKGKRPSRTSWKSAQLVPIRDGGMDGFSQGVGRGSAEGSGSHGRSKEEHSGGVDEQGEKGRLKAGKKEDKKLHPCNHGRKHWASSTGWVVLWVFLSVAVAVALAYFIYHQIRPRASAGGLVEAGASPGATDRLSHARTEV
uniref:Uncharacterized protein n=1 Tax=Chromera velia CCMP2878 TaxID=1169474 RepID=A0A0G4HUR1_9ALVE|eukprot:Cvel_31973.t1-p1 / transcript=Cvel_31973.t1 / gene=Cvel_31973 / organism=Chromera_velia_CCMP2878 / gene_product=hypothetical protein / transcript_product=hypothetical protein / location=Cvel_scaffold4866:4535-6142(+) / protein_length=461 / sequence_SO=supercontig / SO=protein_coding / is_pseudo=false